MSNINKNVLHSQTLWLVHQFKSPQQYSLESKSFGIQFLSGLCKP